MKHYVEKPLNKYCKKICFNLNIYIYIYMQYVCTYILDIGETKHGNVKPLFKTHKPAPWPIMLLLSVTNTPVQPLSKFVQYNIKHLPSHIPNQILDTKEFLQKIMKINSLFDPLPPSTTICTQLCICDVKLYPSINNLMGIPDVRNMLSKFPSPYTLITDCLDCNVCKFTTDDGETHLRMPNHGTAMGPVNPG